MRLLFVGLVVSIMGTGVAQAELFDPISGHSFRTLIETETELAENFGVEDFDSFYKKREQMLAALASLASHRAKGLILIDPGTGKAGSEIIQEELDQLEALYSVIDSQWRQKLTLKKTFGISSYSEYVDLQDQIQREIDGIDIRVDTQDGVLTLSPEKVRVRGELLKRLNHLKDLWAATETI